jgi:hypothetical protein
VLNEMKLKRAITMGDDFAFGYEQVGGFQRVLEDGGGRVVKKLWSPLSTDSIPSEYPVRAVLEINGGSARLLGIKPGDKVRHPIFGNG